MHDFIRDNTTWGLEHPDEAAKIRGEKLRTESGEPAPIEDKPADQPDPNADPNKPADKPADAPPVAATPVKIDEWTTKSPELKAAFDKNPELRTEIMEMARSAEAAKPVLDIVSTVEEAQFAVENANRLVSLQSNWMLAGEDPEMTGPAWDMTVDFFKERDANGAEIKGADGKPKLGADFKPFVAKAAATAIAPHAAQQQSTADALKARLQGNYANEEARQADEKALEQAEYNVAAFNYVTAQLGKGDEPASSLPALPANATKEQIEFQEKLKTERAELDAKAGKTSAADRKASREKLDRSVQTEYEGSITSQIDSRVAAMKERGEHLPEFVLSDKWINPRTQKTTGISAFAMKIYQQVNDKITGNPVHKAKLASYQAMGEAGKDARVAEVKRLVTQYLPKIFDAEVTRIQNGIRETNRPRAAAPAAPAPGAPRLEPTSRATIQPSGALTGAELDKWAATEAAKDPGWENMLASDRYARVASIKAKKQFGG
jgi:hypothetical protein